MLSVQLNFVIQSVLYSNLPDMTGRPTVFQEVDRLAKQISSYTRQKNGY